MIMNAVFRIIHSISYHFHFNHVISILCVHSKSIFKRYLFCSLPVCFRFCCKVMSSSCIRPNSMETCQDYPFQSPIRLLHSIGVFQQLSCTHALFCPNRHTPFIPRTRSFFLLFYRPTHSLCACLSACSDIYDISHSIRTLFFFIFFEY